MMEEIKLNIENLNKEEREHLIRLVEKANKKGSKIWKPDLGEAYYVIDDCSAVYKSAAGLAHDESIDEGRYSIGNCFKTREEAEFALERHKVIVELERFAKENNPEAPPYLCYHLICVCGEVRVAAFSGVITFTDMDVAQRAVKVIGEDRLKRYYFGIKE